MLRRPARVALRALGGALAIAGLAAMHGITASTASASCATVHAMPTQPGQHADHADAPAPPPGPSLASAVPDGMHPGLLCAAVLAAGALLLAARRLGLALEPVRIPVVAGEVRANGSRSPPSPRLLGRWRN